MTMISKGFISGVILIILVLMATKSTQAQAATTKAFFDNYDSETFYFEEPDGMIWEFSNVSKDLIEKHKLKTTDSHGKAFEITYTVKIEIEEEGFEYEVYTIVSMKPIQLERQIEEEEEWEE
jgi:hypothetical protein